MSFLKKIQDQPKNVRKAIFWLIVILIGIIFLFTWVQVFKTRIGQSKLSPFKDGIKMFSSLISIAYSETSLLAKTIMLPSLLFVIMGLFTGISSWIEYISLGAPKHPYYPLITVFTFLIAIQLFSLGLLTDNLTKKLSRIEERMIKKIK